MRCYTCDSILSDEDQRFIYRQECELARKGRVIDKYDEICMGCRLSNDSSEWVDVSEEIGYTVIADE